MLEINLGKSLRRSFFGFLLIVFVVTVTLSPTNPLRFLILAASIVVFFLLATLVIHAQRFEPTTYETAGRARLNPFIQAPRPLNVVLKEAREGGWRVKALALNKLERESTVIPAELGMDVYEFVEKRTRSNDKQVRSEATIALGLVAFRLPDQVRSMLTDRLLELSRNPGPGVLKEAAFALGLGWKAHAPDQKGVVTGQLLTMMESGEETVAEAAADALYRVEPWSDQAANEAVSTRIVPLCHRKEPWIASSAIGKLGAFSSSLSPAWKKTALDEALRAIDDAEWPIGYGAIESLSWLAPSLVGVERSRALDHLLSLEKSRDQFVRTSLAENLARTLRSIEGADRDLVASTLFRMAADKKKLVRRTATKSLRENRGVLSPREAKTLDDLNSR